MPRQFRQPRQPEPLKLSIIIPAYNEERRLPTSLSDIRQFLHDQQMETTTEVIVVDDGSTDGTVAFVNQHMAHWPLLRVLPLIHGGKGKAVNDGVMAARGQYIFLCDADLSMLIDELPKFLPPLSGDYDIIIGSRVLPGAQRIDEPMLRTAMSRVFNTLVRVTALPGISDTQCGFKSLKRTVAQQLFTEVTQTGFGFDVEVLALARMRGYTIAEVPIRWVYGPNSRVNPVKDSFRMARDVMTVRVRVRQIAATNDGDAIDERLRRYWATQQTQIVSHLTEAPTETIVKPPMALETGTAKPQEVLFWTLHDTQEVIVISVPPDTLLPENSTPSAWSRTGELPRWLIETEDTNDTVPRPIIGRHD